MNNLIEKSLEEFSENFSIGEGRKWILTEEEEYEITAFWKEKMEQMYQAGFDKGGFYDFEIINDQINKAKKEAIAQREKEIVEHVNEEIIIWTHGCHMPERRGALIALKDLIDYLTKNKK